MKKLFITIITILLPMLATGQTLLYENDFKGTTILKSIKNVEIVKAENPAESGRTTWRCSSSAKRVPRATRSGR